MTTLQDQWAQNNKAWWQSVTTKNGRFAFCFADRWSTQKDYAYYVSANGYVTTEQYASGLNQTIPALQIKHANNFRTQSAGRHLFVVSEHGKLYAVNASSFVFKDENDSYAFPPDKPPFNFLGFGPVSADADSDNDNPDALRKNSRYFVPSLRPIIGDTEAFQDVRFLETAFCATTCVALSEQGHLWYSGNAHVDFMELASAFPGGIGELNYFRESQVTEYIDATGTVSAGSAITFDHIWATGGVSFGALLALGTDGRLFIKGRFQLGKERQSRTFYEVSGFVDSVALSSGGSGYTNTPTVTVSAPGNADGTTATIQAVVSGGAVTELRITNSGWGYTEAPTITFSGGGGSGAAASATLFEDTWQDADIVSTTSGFALPTIAAVSASGTLYSWGTRVLNPNNNNNDTMEVLAPQKIRNQTHSDYVSVAIGHNDGSLDPSFGAALTEDGTLETWGRGASASQRLTPDKSNQNDLTVHSTADVFVKIQGGYRMMALLTDDGRVFTYGNNSGYTGRANSLGTINNSHVSIGQIDGDAVWKDIFLTRDSIVFARDEEVDRLGNRVNPLEPTSGPYTAH